MAAQIPIKNDSYANEQALAKVRADKEREANDGHDGTWVAHPGLVPIALEIFDKYMPQPNQKDKLREDVNVTASDLLEVPKTGEITEAGLRNNVSAALQYMEAWLGGNGCVPINNLMEDAATAEIARAQLWQWIRYPKGVLNDGRKITVELVQQVIKEELHTICNQVSEPRYQAGHYTLAADLLAFIVTNEQFAEFLTLVAYDYLP
jgi:malate synthase